MFCSFYKSILDFVEDTTIQNNLREIIERIRTLTLQRNKVENDVELDPNMREETLFVLEDNLLKLHKLLPKLEELINTYIPGKAMKTLVFLLHKASEVTRLFN